MPKRIDFTRIGVLKLLCFAAAAALLLPLPIMEYVGEESYYTLSVIEMWISGDYWHHLIFGVVWPKTPMFHWFILAICHVIGIEHVDIAARLVSVFASWGAALVAALFARHVFPQHAHVGWLAALIYLTMGEIAFWYGWLGYADATFGAFVFASIATLWLALERQHMGWFLLSLLFVSCAYMTKNISAYALFALAGMVLLIRFKRWKLLLHPLFVVAGVLALSIPWLYQYYFSQTGSNALLAVGDGLRNFSGHDFMAYLKHWISYPAIFIFRALPLSLLFLWLWLGKKQHFRIDGSLLTLCWILLACLLPFWLSAAGSPRYLVPLYGLVALLLTGLLLQLDKKMFRMAMISMLVILVVKIPYSFAVLPYIKDWRADRSLKAVVVDVLDKTRDKPVYTRNDTAAGLSIAAYMNVRLPLEQHIRWDNTDKHGIFIMAEAPDADIGELVKDYPIRGRHLYLYWRP
ncbi:MAG: glycosyltransferase family 39 protein [Mariprofundaceae bacterium]|nr:glycosyltransferase family 39 protein [Mariprofundaceae bacterium]